MDFVGFFCVMGPKSGIMGLGVMDISTSPENHEDEDIWDLLKVKFKSY